MEVLQWLLSWLINVKKVLYYQLDIRKLLLMLQLSCHLGKIALMMTKAFSQYVGKHFLIPSWQKRIYFEIILTIASSKTFPQKLPLFSSASRCKQNELDSNATT